VVQLSSLSDEQLLQLERQTTGGGQQDLSSLSDQELLALEQQTAQSPQSDIFTKEFPEAQKSPLSFLDRIVLSTADDPGRKATLEKRFNFVQRLDNGKFAVGNSPNNLVPIDPEGVFNDVLGDLADVVGEIPVVAGQIVGTGLGATAGSIVPGAGTGAGALLGAGLGAGAGEAVKIAAGRFAGVRKGDATSEAIDIGINTLFGAAGEGLARFVGFAGKRVLLPRVSRVLDKQVAKSTGVDPITGAVLDKPSTPFVKARSNSLFL